MKNLIIEKAVKGDDEILSIIAFEAKQHWGYPDEWMRMWKSSLIITNDYIEANLVYKLLLETEVVGFIAIEEDKEKFEIAHLWIMPNYMGRGYGKMLLNEAILQVAKPGAEIIVESDPNAEPFYSKQGFVTFDRRESYPKGRFLPLMRKLCF